MATYFEQITALLNKHAAIRSLKKRRNSLLKDIRNIACKFTSLEDQCVEKTNKLYKEVEILDLELEIFEELDTSIQQVLFVEKLCQEDHYLSEVSQQYQDELIAIELEIVNLQNQDPQNPQDPEPHQASQDISKAQDALLAR